MHNNNNKSTTVTGLIVIDRATEHITDDVTEMHVTMPTHYIDADHPVWECAIHVVFEIAHALNRANETGTVEPLRTTLTSAMADITDAMADVMIHNGLTDATEPRETSDVS